MAQVDILFTGYVGDRVAGTVSLVRAGDAVIVIDPGMVPDRGAILDPMERIGVAPEDVTDIVLSHHHPDHTVNIALFPQVRVHDHWAIYESDVWTSRPAEGFAVAPHVTLMETPAHTPQDITTLVQTEKASYAFTHLWWHEGVGGDPLAVQPELLQHNRERVLDVATIIVPGHGGPFDAAAAPRVPD